MTLYRWRDHLGELDAYWITGQRAADVLGVNVARLNALAVKGFIPHAGVVGRQGTGGRPRKDEQKPTAVLPHVSGELNGNNAGIYGLSDHVEPEQLEEALIDAKAEGNLSRANVVRKVAWDPLEWTNVGRRHQSATPKAPGSPDVCRPRD